MPLKENADIVPYKTYPRKGFDKLFLSFLNVANQCYIWAWRNTKVFRWKHWAFWRRVKCAILRRMNGESKVFAVARPTFAAIVPAVSGYVFLLVVAGLFALAEREVAAAFYLACVFGGLALIGIAGKMVGGAIAAACNVYTFSTDSVKSRTGFIATRTAEVRVADIRGVVVTRSIWGRILGFASAEIGTAATGGAEIHIRNVRNLDAIVAQLEALRAK